MQSIDRAVQVLDLLSTHREGIPISEIGEITGLPLSTTHRLLHSLTAHSLAVQDPVTKRYKLGLRVLGLASFLLNNNRVIEAARPHMARLASSQGKLVYFCQEQNDEIVCVDSSMGSARINVQFYVQIGSLMPFHASAPAKAILAHSPPEKLERLLRKNSPLHRYTPRTISAPKEVLGEYRVCREQGYAVCDEEMEPGVCAVAAPVFGYDNGVLGSVALVDLKREDRMEEMIRGIVGCARDISREMGSP